MDSDIILLGHGSGGEMSHQLLEQLIIPILSGSAFSQRNDAAVIDCPTRQLAFSTDSYVVDPIFFPGGNIGDLAINGTVNDLAMRGAIPLAISVALILEEGLAVDDLRRILESMAAAARHAGVDIVTGDTKVVPRGSVDQVFINTSGIGLLNDGVSISGDQACVGDRVLINGTIGDHGMTVLACREELALSTTLETDSMALNHLVADLVATFGGKIHVLRDPTRGGVATTLKEIALQSQVAIQLNESSLPVKPAVSGLSALLGLDPLFVANEGKLLVIVAAEVADEAVALMRRHSVGSDAADIGAIGGDFEAGSLILNTAIGGQRRVEMLSGDLLPRIC
ncbi:MAG: hydrogenase expression/formation protein HypE [Desulfuromonadales bacterium C00003068]|nr:MAG: hydrogenase expression/formation protein HypE [Desulfuromonadales bacterium C00003068]